MKRRLITLFVMALVLVFSTRLPASAKPVRVPHEDPALAQNALDPISLMLSYNNIFDMMSAKQYKAAQVSLKELERASVPDELRYVVSRYTALAQRLLNTLDRLEASLNEASTFLGRNQLGDAQGKLREAEANLNNAQSVLRDIRNSTGPMTTEYSRLATFAADRLIEIQGRISQSLARLNQMVNELSRRSQELAAMEQTNSATLVPTELTISASATSAFVGDSLTVSGQLSGRNQPLSGRKFTLYVEQIPFAASTDAEGRYNASISLPFRYAPKATLRAGFIPAGDDVNRYQASESPPLEIATLFYASELSLTAPPSIAPGLPFAVTGSVKSPGGNTDRSLKVLLDGTPVASASVGADFRFDLSMPPGSAPGNHSLTATLAASERFAETTRQLTIVASTLPVEIETEAAPVVIIPGSLQVSGRATSRNAPLPGAKVNITFRDTSRTAVTAPDGSFQARLQAPLDLIGLQDVTVAIVPAEPWFERMETKMSIFAVNSIYLGLMLLVLLAAGLFAYRQRARPAVLTAAAGIPIVLEIPGTLREPQTAPGLTGPRGKILSAYTTALAIIEKSTGAALSPQATLREFLILVSPRLASGALERFTALTALAEAALYSAVEPGEAMLQEAAGLALPQEVPHEAA